MNGSAALFLLALNGSLVEEGMANFENIFNNKGSDVFLTRSVREGKHK